MASHGKSETTRLRDQVQEQLNRLLTQLADVEALRDDLDEEDYIETRKETVEQLREFQQTLKKMMAGDMTLVDEFGSVQLAIQAAISEAFSTPEVIGMFARKQPTQLRQRLTNLQRDVKLGKLPREAVTTQAVEILVALQKLGQTLSPHEIAFLEKHQSASLRSFASSRAQVGAASTGDLLSIASEDVKRAQQ